MTECPTIQREEPANPAIAPSATANPRQAKPTANPRQAKPTIAKAAAPRKPQTPPKPPAAARKPARSPAKPKAAPPAAPRKAAPAPRKLKLEKGEAEAKVGEAAGGDGKDEKKGGVGGEAVAVAAAGGLSRQTVEAGGEGIVPERHAARPDMSSTGIAHEEERSPAPDMAFIQIFLVTGETLT